MSGQHCENYDVKREQLTVTREMLTTVARGQRWPDGAGISARFSKFALVLFCYMTNHSMTSSLGNSDFVSLLEYQCSSRRKFSFSGNRIHCSSLDQSFSVKCQPIPTHPLIGNLYRVFIEL